MLLLLMYLLLRYRFIGGAMRAWHGSRSESHASRRRLAQDVLQAQVRRYETRGLESSALRNALISAVASRTPDHLKDTRPRIDYTFVSEDGPFSGTIQLELLWNQDRIGNSSDTPLRYEIRGWDRWLIELKVTTRLLIYSEACTEMVVPILLSFSAVGTVIWRLIETIP